MTNLFQRESDGSYTVRSSSGQGSYHVTMFGLDAVFCECVGNKRFGKHCKHMETAEIAEALYQEKQRAKEPEHPFQHAELTRPAGFSLLK